MWTVKFTWTTILQAYKKGTSTGAFANRPCTLSMQPQLLFDKNEAGRALLFVAGKPAHRIYYYITYVASHGEIAVLVHVQ